MKRFLFIGCLFAFFAASSCYAQTTVPSAGALAFSSGPLGNNLAVAITNSNFSGSFTGSGNLESRGGTPYPTFSAGMVFSCTYAGTQVYPNTELPYFFKAYPGYFSLTVFSDAERKLPYVTCEGTQAPAVLAEVNGTGKFQEKIN